LLLFLGVLFLFVRECRECALILLFAELSRHKPTLHYFSIVLSPPKSPDVWHGDRSPLSRSLIGQIHVMPFRVQITYLRSRARRYNFVAVAKFFLACPQICVVPPPQFQGHSRGIPQWKKSTFGTCCRGLDIFQLGTDIRTPIL